MTAISAVLFDAGGTLWRVKAPRAEVWGGLLSEMGFDVPLERLDQAVEEADQQVAPRWDALDASGRPNGPSAIEDLWDDWAEIVLQGVDVRLDIEQLRPRLSERYRGNRELYPETLGVLTRLRDMGLRMAIVSNGVDQEANTVRRGIAGFFETVIGSIHVGFAKPAPEIYHLALSALEIGPEEAIMVGDTWEADVVGAEGVGIKAIHVNRGEEPSPSPEAIQDLWGVVDLLKDTVSS